MPTPRAAGEPAATEEEHTESRRAPTGIGGRGLVLGLVIGILAGAIPALVFYQQTTFDARTLLDQRAQIANLGGDIEDLQTQLTAKSAEAANLQGQVQTLQGEIGLLGQQFEALQAQSENETMRLLGQIATLQSESRTLLEQLRVFENQSEAFIEQVRRFELQRAADAATIGNLTAQVNTLQAQITTLQGQITSLNSQIASLQTQVSQLQALLNLQVSSQLISQTVSIPANQSASWTFSTQITYAGYLRITYSTTGPVHIEVVTGNGTLTTTSANSATRFIPVIPGQTYQVFIENESTTTTRSVTVTITYVS
jgi:peptidoglycan hydrolase CwlO-like protein